jgi:hypothetical protein
MGRTYDHDNDDARTRAFKPLRLVDPDREEGELVNVFFWNAAPVLAFRDVDVLVVRDKAEKEEE